MNLITNVGDTLQSESNIKIQTSPFNQLRSELPRSTSITCNQTKRNADHMNINGNTPPVVADRKETKEAAVVVSHVFSNDTFSKYGLNSRSYRNDLNIKTSAYKNTYQSNKVSGSVQNIESNAFDVQYGTCSKYIPSKASVFPDQKVTCANFQGSSQRPIPSFQLSPSSCSVAIGDEKKFAEKTTFCRPVTNYYNQQFIYKTMQRNDRLQKLMKKIILVRQREKQKELWNNYINDLKNKHGYYNNEPRTITDQYIPEYGNTEMIDDCYNTRFTWKQSDPCQNLLQDFYGKNLQAPSNVPEVLPEGPSRDQRSFLYENDSFCFPTSSQACGLMRSRERGREHYNYQKSKQLTPGRLYGPSIVVERDYRQRSKYTKEKNKYSLIRNSSIQTDLNVLPLLVDVTRHSSAEEDNNISKEETIKEKYSRVSDNVDRLKKKIECCQSEVRESPLANIETKLDTLIRSINEFMIEVKSRKTSYDNNKSAAVSCKLSKLSKNSSDSIKSYKINNNKLNLSSSDTFGRSKTEEVLCNVVDSTSRTMLGLVTSKLKRVESGTSKLNKILNEELSKSNKVKRDIENILNSKVERPCAVQITFDIPTRDRSTEVTDSLSKTRLDSEVIIEEIDAPKSMLNGNTRNITRSVDDNNMTIAVNTDPLGLLALLRISRETIKQLLSYMPNIDYSSYLPLLSPQRQLTNVSHYICNICGAAFGRPSQLSDHIQEHNLGKSKDCCVCRHVLDVQRNRSGLFACQYCGQRFTRAYCCELHQQTCARRLGRRHDISSSLMLLR